MYTRPWSAGHARMVNRTPKDRKIAAVRVMDHRYSVVIIPRSPVGSFPSALLDPAFDWITRRDKASGVMVGFKSSGSDPSSIRRAGPAAGGAPRNEDATRGDLHWSGDRLFPP